jgi:hypothetical protein
MSDQNEVFYDPENDFSEIASIQEKSLPNSISSMSNIMGTQSNAALSEDISMIRNSLQLIKNKLISLENSMERLQESVTNLVSSFLFSMRDSFLKLLICRDDMTLSRKSLIVWKERSIVGLHFGLPLHFYLFFYGLLYLSCL